MEYRTGAAHLVLGERVHCQPVNRLDSGIVFAESMMRLAVLGVVEPGYAIASIRRGCSHVRPPWAPKGVIVPLLPNPSTTEL